MKQQKTLGWLAIGVMVVALAVGVAPAFAQGETPSTTPAPLAHGGGFGGRGMCGQAGLDAAAKTLKLTTEELTAQLWGGQTLSGLAEKAGVELTAVQSAVEAACLQAQKDAIQQAVTDGQITQAQADWILEGLEKGYLGGKGGFGFGFGMLGRGRGHGFGGFGVPKGTTPNSGTTPNNGTTTPNSYQF
ncbi:hypothetical protein TFLX_01196 [Thermoflexales bacterium]|nr:hypothetical protein TFLX_01196 [Thermoflexales bacterium]